MNKSQKVKSKNPPPKKHKEVKEQKCDSQPDYSSLCEKILGKLKNGFSEKKDSDNDMKEMINELTMIKNKFDQMKNIGNAFKNRIRLLGSFAKTCCGFFGVYPSIKGGHFRRKLYEAPFSIGDIFSDEKYGNPIDTEIELNVTYDDDDLYEFILTLEEFIKRPENDRLVFSNYRLDKIIRDRYYLGTNMEVPKDRYKKYKLYFNRNDNHLDENENTIIISLATYDQYENSSRVDLLDIMSNSDTSDIFEGFNDIINRRNALNYSLTSYIEKLKSPMERSNKKIIWGKIIDVFLNMIDTLKNGYKTIDIGDNKMIKFSVEEDTECPITACSAPYIKIHMNCGHELSLMSVCGIVINGSSDDTESIKCPLCRANLFPKLIPASSEEEYKESRLKYYSKKYLLNNKQKNNNKTNTNNSYINSMSNEAKDYIKSIYDKENDSKYCHCDKRMNINDSEDSMNDNVLLEYSYSINIPKDIKTLDDTDDDEVTYDDDGSEDSNQDD